MPPQNTLEQSIQQQNARRRPVPVIPAIPLALSKPKGAKTRPKQEKDARAGAVQPTSVVSGPDVTDTTSPAVRPVMNGEDHAHIHDAGVAVRPSSAEVVPSDRDGSSTLSNGTAPGLASLEDGNTPLRSRTGAVEHNATPASDVKHSDKFDMRQIRTELPPAFIPSAEQHTPRSAASSQSSRPFMMPVHGHPARPSTSSIVFGGQDSSTSSPVPPHSAGSAYGPPPNSGSSHPPAAYHGHQGHGQQSSDSYTPRYSAPTFHQPPVPWNARSGYVHSPQSTSFTHPHAHPPFRYPPGESFSPSEPHHSNGRLSRSRSASQSSSAGKDHIRPSQNLHSPLSLGSTSELNNAMFHEHKPSYYGDRPQPHRPANLRAHMALIPHFQHPDVASNAENAEALRGYVLEGFANPVFADCRIEITDRNSSSHEVLDGHRLLLGRSPKLSSLLRTDVTSSPSTSKPAVKVELEGKYLNISTFFDALRYLYGGPLLQLDHHRPGPSTSEHGLSNTERMDNALHHIATGSWIQIHAFAIRGVEVAASLLHWDTIIAALSFALDGGLGASWTVEYGSEDRASTSSSEESLRPDAPGSPSYDPYSTNLLHRIVEFTVHMFPPNFYLDASAPQLGSCARLPAPETVHESRSFRADPRLSQIRFGEMSTDDHQRPSFATTTISSILLSLPFPLLKAVLEHFDLALRLGAETVASIMRQVVAERENRRSTALKARIAEQMDESTDPQLVQNLYWQESVEMSLQHRAGARLARRRKGIDTPPSSGACSERNK